YFAYEGPREDTKAFIDTAMTTALGRVWGLDALESGYSASGARNSLKLYGIQALNGRGIGVDSWDQIMHADIYLSRQGAGRAIVGILTPLLYNFRQFSRPMVTELYANYVGDDKRYSFLEILMGNAERTSEMKGRRGRTIGDTDKLTYKLETDREWI